MSDDNSSREKGESVTGGQQESILVLLSVFIHAVSGLLSLVFSFKMNLCSHNVHCSQDGLFFLFVYKYTMFAVFV